MKQIKSIVKDAAYLPLKKLGQPLAKSIIEKLSFKFFDEKACKECDNVHQRFNDLCEVCPSYTGGVNLGRQVVVGENKYVKIPIGSSGKVYEQLRKNGFDVTIVHKSPVTQIAPIKFTGTLKPEQRVAVDIIKAKGRGVLKAPPRSGKTVSGTALTCELQKKTLIIASQRDWLMGFQETFIGSKTQKALTNLDPSRIKLCKKYEDFCSADIAMATVQTFYSDAGMKLLEKIRSKYEVVLIDECHSGNASKFLGILAKLNTRIMIGLSATPQRKDMRDILVENVVGPIIHEVKVERMRPRVYLTKTAYSKTYKGQVQWANMISALENDKSRLALIAKTAVQDIKAGHLVMIPFAQVKPVNTLIQLINELAGERLAFPFLGNLKKSVRDETIQKAREYEIKCLVGTMKILSTGINIPRASALYEVSPSSNIPNAEQRMARVLTPMENKVAPIIRLFLDDMNVRKNCMRNEYFHALKPIFKPILSAQDNDALMKYFNGKQQEKFQW